MTGIFLGVGSFVFLNNRGDFADLLVFSLKAFLVRPYEVRPLNFNPVLRSTKVSRVVEDKISFFEFLP